MSEEARLASLLDEARTVLRGELMPLLDGEARYRAAMIASLLAITARHLRQGERDALAEAAALLPLCDAAIGSGRAERRRAAAAAIRSGAFDGEEAALRAALAARLAAGAGDEG